MKFILDKEHSNCFLTILFHFKLLENTGSISGRKNAILAEKGNDGS